MSKKFLLCCLMLMPTTGVLAQDHPDVLMINIDDMNDWVGVLGGHPQARTPNIDALAARGMLFRNAHTPAAACLPARTAILTGVSPFNSGIYNQLGDWRQNGAHRRLDRHTEAVLMADEYRSVSFVRELGEAPVDLFITWYDDQMDGGVHSPEICLPASGWEIAWLERVNIDTVVSAEQAFNINRAVIQRGETRMLVYYWFQQGERRVARDMATKFYLMLEALRTGYTGGGMVRLITPIERGETEAQAEGRLQDMLGELMPVLPRFLPAGPDERPDTDA